ncbi:hypothetical protein LIER_34636 [Lithospermum erythrorhizon]|uniref:MULE transposase domain-containing protein n=1 Tax=Lithospermum erythrorhizon TaxID=34254 RepID=A0AAV3S034_LITER
MTLKLGQHVNKWEAWRVKEAALRVIYGDEEEQFKWLWDYCTEVVTTNEGTRCYVKTVDNEEGKAVFQRWGGQLLVAIGLDPNNNIFPIAYGLVEVENKVSWKWFLSHLYEDIREGIDEHEQEYWTFMSDKQKGLIEAFKTVLPNVNYRFCVRYLHENFKRADFRGHTFKVSLWTVATASTTQYFDYAMKKMKKFDLKAFEWFGDKDPKIWSMAFFSLTPKCDVLLNNMCEVFNSFILDARDKLVITMMNMLKDLIMMRMEINREKTEKWEGTLCPKPRARLLDNIKEASSYMPIKCDKGKFQVCSSSQANQCAIDLEKRHYTYLWPQTDRVPPLPPPLTSKKAGRITKLRGVNPIEVEDKGKTQIL